MELNTDYGDGFLLADKQSIPNLENSIYNYGLLSTTATNSEDHKE